MLVVLKSTQGHAELTGCHIDRVFTVEVVAKFGAFIHRRFESVETKMQQCFKETLGLKLVNAVRKLFEKVAFRKTFHERKLRAMFLTHTFTRGMGCILKRSKVQRQSCRHTSFAMNIPSTKMIDVDTISFHIHSVKTTPALRKRAKI